MSDLDPTLEELEKRQKARFKESAAQEAEEEEARLAASAEKDRQAYLRRTGRTEMKP